MVDALITGGSGFIGKHLSKRILDLSKQFAFHDVIKNLDLVENLDINKPNTCEYSVGNRPKIIFHLAAQPIVERAVKYPASTLETNIVGSYNLLEAVRTYPYGNYKPLAIVWMTTDKVYGENEDALETDPLNGTSHPYDASKVCSDVLAQMYAETFDLPIVIIRSGNVYGEGDFHNERLVPSLIKSIYHGEKPKIRSDGTLKRDYIYIDDVVRGLLLSAREMALGHLKHGQIINFGAAESHTVLEVADEIMNIAGRIDLSMVIENRVKDELKSQHMNWDLANRLLGWYPKTNLRTGLEKTWEWYSEYFKYNNI